ncbi:hypothetical protein AAUPMB_04305 [Pasteurella multocida subsp. multocida str. Anand1_buffalo]|nr:hypothetical protein AAUPMB_04305 [Pasteurella multocida subsp. multocida str. Anand1_buffalo]
MAGTSAAMLGFAPTEALASASQLQIITRQRNA